jgi:3-oxoacyl-[acyl-carrier-protein] synthase II
MSKRVVVTGVGVVAPNGIGKEAFWQALITGLSGVRSIRRFDSSSLPTRVAGEVTQLDPLQYFEPHELKKVDRSNVFALAAGLMAMDDSGIDLKHQDLERVGSSVGNAVCGIEYAQKESDIIYGKGPRWGSPYLAIAFFPCGSNGLLSIRLQMKGPVLTFCNGNTSGTDAIGMAYRMVRSGKADVMLAGGTEAPLIPLFIGSMARDGWLSKANDLPETASRPFDRSADGMVLSEGAGMVVLEEYEHARARGARIYTELVAYSTVNSAYDIFHPEPNGYGIERSMNETLREAGLTPSSVSWVNAQGFSIPEYDRVERRCVHNVFAGPSEFPRVSAVSSWIGNPIGALGGIQAVASALAMERQAIPPHQAVSMEDSPDRIRLVERGSEETDVSVIVQNSFCFMGKSSSLVFKRL